MPSHSDRVRRNYPADVKKELDLNTPFSFDDPEVQRIAQTLTHQLTILDAASSQGTLSRGRHKFERFRAISYAFKKYAAYVNGHRRS